MRANMAGSQEGRWRQRDIAGAGAGVTALGVTDVPLVAIAKGPDRDAGRETFFMPGKNPFKLPPRIPCSISSSGCRRSPSLRHRLASHAAQEGHPRGRLPGNSGDRAHNLGVTHETAVRSAFQGLLDHCARQHDWTLVPEWEIRRPRQHPLRVDGALLDNFRLTHGFWEAKDSRDDLPKEARKKFDLGYPRDNILFQTPRRALLFQNDTLAFDADLTQPPALIDALNAFFSYTPPAYTEWERAVSEFQDRVPELARSLIKSSKGAQDQPAVHPGVCRLRATRPALHQSQSRRRRRRGNAHPTQARRDSRSTAPASWGSSWP